MKTLHLNIECGAKTCASEPGKFCRFLGAESFGTKPVCMLFPHEDQSFTPLSSIGGWRQRCPECLQAERDAPDCLSAAAPELFVALKTPVAHGGIGPQDRFEDAKDATAKAEGRTA
jgi:hypothetical protein